MSKIANLPAPLTDLPTIGRKAAEFARSSKASATLRAYESDWRDFVGWCQALDLDYLPAEPATVGAYLSDRAGVLKVATLDRRRAAIAFYHRRGGHGFDNEHLAISSVMSGIRRTHGSHQEAKTALLTEDLRAFVRATPDTLRGARDRAIMLVGFAGAFRRSELVALDREDCEITHGGIAITIRRSKTDQEGMGRQVGFPRSKRTCPVAALEQWLRLAGIETGAVFRTVYRNRPGERLIGKAVADIVKAAARRAGYDPRKYGGHSLRSGFATSAARAGADLAHIMQQTGHRNAEVARRYVHAGKLLENPASKAVRL
jgi:site-specific recombinase XerD